MRDGVGMEGDGMEASGVRGPVGCGVVCMTNASLS
jgi:hypothetical protein